MGETLEKKNNLKLIKFSDSQKMCPHTEDTLKYKDIKITKRNDNRWQARYLENGTYKYVYDKTQKGCYDKLKTLYNPTANKKISNTTLNDWIQQWKTLYKIGKVKDSTLYHIELDLKNHIQKQIGVKNIKNITMIDILTLLNSLNGERLKQVIYTLLCDIFDKALKNNIINKM